MNNKTADTDRIDQERLDGFDRLLAEADAKKAKVPVVAAGGDDPGLLVALRVAASRGWVEPTIVGPERLVVEAGIETGVNLGRFRVIDAEPADVAECAVAEVKQGRAEILIKGRVKSPDLIRAVCHPGDGIRDGRVIGQVVLMEIPRDGRRFLLTDTGVNVRPTLTQKADLLQSAAGVAHALGVDRPLVAVMAATESINVSMHETLDAAALQSRNQAGDFPDCIVEGPLSFDLAYAPDAAEKKRITGQVAGSADLMLFADLLSANLTVKAIMYTSDCRYGGLLLGTTHPVAFMSRSDNAATRLHSIALALRMFARKAAR